MKEQIFVFDANYMDGFAQLPGISTLAEDMQHLKYECARHGYFVDRTKAEVDEGKKQLIPYVLILRGNQIFAYQRSKKSKEGRLHSKWSIGIGGHINPLDTYPKLGINTLLSTAIQRELTEELDWGDQEICTINNLTEYGVLYDDTESVGRVHIGYIVVINVPKGSKYPVPKEDTIAASQWLSLRKTSALPNLERWSKMILETMTSGAK